MQPMGMEQTRTQATATRQPRRGRQAAPPLLADPGGESEALLRSTFDGLSAHVAVLDKNGTIVAVNHAWRAFRPVGLSRSRSRRRHELPHDLRARCSAVHRHSGSGWARLSLAAADAVVRLEVADG